MTAMTKLKDFSPLFKMTKTQTSTTTSEKSVTANKTTTSEIITVNHTISAVHSEAMKKITKEKMKAMEK
jgi:hypothetical protein